MKNLLNKMFLSLAIFAFLIFIIVHCKIALKNAYDEGAFSGYAEGCLKHKYSPESNAFLYTTKNASITYLS